jgi:hypothetical protein
MREQANMGMRNQSTAAPGFDVMGYLHQHSGDIMLMLAISTLVTMSHWRNWLYAEDLKLPDGSTDPRAGKLNVRRAVGEFLFVPALVVFGLLFLGFNSNTAWAGAFVAVCAFVGSAFLFTTFERARDGALGVALQALANLIPGGKK